MIVSHKLKFIFIHVHRTAGIAFSNTLRQSLVNHFEIYVQHSNAKSTSLDIQGELADYFVFGFTRNPWQRILSWYSLIHHADPLGVEEERLRLEEFIASDAAIDPQQSFFYNSLDYFTNDEGNLISDTIYRYENLADSIKEFSSKFDLYMGRMPVLNESQKKNYREYFTDKSRQLISEKCHKDIEYFGYHF